MAHINRTVPSAYGTDLFYPRIPLYTYHLQPSSQLYASPALPSVFLPAYSISPTNYYPDNRLELILIAALILLALDLIFIRPRNKANL